MQTTVGKSSDKRTRWLLRARCGSRGKPLETCLYEDVISPVPADVSGTNIKEKFIQVKSEFRMYVIDMILIRLAMQVLRSASQLSSINGSKECIGCHSQHSQTSQQKETANFEFLSCWKLQIPYQGQRGAKNGNVKHHIRYCDAQEISLKVSTFAREQQVRVP